MCPDCVERYKHCMVLAERIGVLRRALIDARHYHEPLPGLDHQCEIDAIDAALMAIGEPICGVDAAYRTRPLGENNESR